MMRSWPGQENFRLAREASPHPNFGIATDSPLVIVINNESGYVSASETFLNGHINGIGLPTSPVIGVPNARLLVNENRTPVSSQSMLARASRVLLRKVGLETVSSQDQRSFTRFLRARRTGAVLAEYGSTAVTVMRACREANVPLISHFHGFDAYRKYELDRHASLYPELFRSSVAIVAVSSHMRDKLLSLGAPPERLHVNPCGPRIPEHLCASPATAGCHFIMVGRLVPKKGPQYSLRSFAKVVRRVPAARLEIIGDGPLAPECYELARELDIEKYITWYGSQSHQFTLDKMSEGRCFIQHSVTAPDGDMEGTPVSVLEAMALGLPCVATRHGGIADVISDGRTGSLVDEGDVDGMARAMMDYATEPERAQSVGEAGREVVLAGWTADHSHDRLRSIILNAI